MADTATVETATTEASSSEKPKWAPKEKLDLVKTPYQQSLAGIDVIITDVAETEDGFPEVTLADKLTKLEKNIIIDRSLSPTAFKEAAIGHINKSRRKDPVAKDATSEIKAPPTPVSEEQLAPVNAEHRKLV